MSFYSGHVRFQGFARELVVMPVTHYLTESLQEGRAQKSTAWPLMHRKVVLLC